MAICVAEWTPVKTNLPRALFLQVQLQLFLKQGEIGVCVLMSLFEEASTLDEYMWYINYLRKCIVCLCTIWCTEKEEEKTTEQVFRGMCILCP